MIKIKTFNLTCLLITASSLVAVYEFEDPWKTEEHLSPAPSQPAPIVNRAVAMSTEQPVARPTVAHTGIGPAQAPQPATQANKTTYGKKSTFLDWFVIGRSPGRVVGE